MNGEQKEVFEKLKRDFLRIKGGKKFTASDEEKLNIYVTGMLGLFAMKADLDIANQAEKMISFGEKNLWAMHGHRIEFDRLKKRYHIR